MDDVTKCGFLRKQKSMRRRFFVLRSGGSRGPARLEYYESEKKFRAAEGSAGPRRVLNLEETFGVYKRADAKRRHLLVLYTRDGGLGVSADGEDEQDQWYRAILQAQAQARSLSSPPTPPEAPSWPGPAFLEIWQVSLRPRGLGQTRGLSGIYRLCLTERTLSLLRLRSDAPSVTLQLMNVRRCGHSDNYFFVEVGRSAITGPGELWMQVEDSVVAQNMHETILEAMKSLSEELRPRTKSQSLSSTPITVPSRRHHPNPPPPSLVGFSHRSRAEVIPDGSPAPKSHSPPGGDHGPHPPEEEEEEKCPRPESNLPPADYGSASSDEYGSSPSIYDHPAYMLPSPGSTETNYISMAQHGRRAHVEDPTAATILAAEEEGGREAEQEDNYAVMGCRGHQQEAGYMPMLPGSRSQDYMPMTPNSGSPPAPLEMTGYVMMSPLGSCSPEMERASWPPSGEISVGSADSHISDYMNMWPLSRSASSTPPPLDVGLSSGNVAQRVPASYRSLPRSYKTGVAPPSRVYHSSSSSESLEEVARGGGKQRRPLSVSAETWRTGTLHLNYQRPPSPGEYVSIRFRARREEATKQEDVPAAEYIAMEMRPALVPNGDYTEMVFGPGTEKALEPEISKAAGPTKEKALVPTMDNALRPTTQKALGFMPTTEKALRPTTEKALGPTMITDKAFGPTTPMDMTLGPSAKSGPPAEKAFGPTEKTSGPGPATEDSELIGPVAVIIGCGLQKGPDRSKLVRADPAGRRRHCSETFAQAPSASCNGARGPVAEPSLNYIDLDLVKDVGSAAPSAAPAGTAVTQPVKAGPLGATSSINTYASIDFQMSGVLRRGSKDGNTEIL